MNYLRIWSEHYPQFEVIANNFGLWQLHCPNGVDYFELGDRVTVNAQNALVADINYEENMVYVSAPFVSEVNEFFHRFLFIFWDPPSSGELQDVYMGSTQSNNSGHIISNSLDKVNLHLIAWNVPVTLQNIRESKCERTVMEFIDFLQLARSKPLNVEYREDTGYFQMMLGCWLASSEAQLTAEKDNFYQTNISFIGKGVFGL